MYYYGDGNKTGDAIAHALKQGDNAAAQLSLEIEEAIVKCGAIAEDMGAQVIFARADDLLFKLEGTAPQGSVLRMHRAYNHLTHGLNLTFGCGDRAIVALEAMRKNKERSIGVCRSCGAPIYWGKTAAGESCPFDLDGVSHFATCPDAKKWSKK